MSFEFDNVLPVLDITEDAIITPVKEEEVEDLDNPILDEQEDEQIEGDTKVSTINRSATAARR